jgi:hypothetical protein
MTERAEGIPLFLLAVVFLWGLCAPVHAFFRRSPEKGRQPREKIRHPASEAVPFPEPADRKRETGTERTAWRPAGTGLRLENGWVWTVAVAGGTAPMKAWKRNSRADERDRGGGPGGTVYKNLIQAWIPVESLESVAGVEAVVHPEPPAAQDHRRSALTGNPMPPGSSRPGQVLRAADPADERPAPAPW